MSPTTAQRIGRAVRVALTEQGRSQTDLADAFGMTQQATSRRITGAVSFRADELAQIAEWLGVSVARFYEPPSRSGPKQPAQTPPAAPSANDSAA